MSKILITGTAGFIGFHLAKSLLEKGHSVVGIDNINDYYDVRLKYDRLGITGIAKSDIEWDKEVISKIYSDYVFVQMDLENKERLQTLFEKYQFDIVVNLAAQAGVRYSLENPDTYIQSNIVGFLNILECCRHNKIKHLLYASSSSVYGENDKVPFSVDDNVDHPVSLYAATKKSNELMAYTYSHLYGIPTTGLRFFTVYGPWGRPDMAIYLFVKAITERKPIKIFNNGDMQRDFTYIDDIINGIHLLIDTLPTKNSNSAPYALANIGNGSPQSLKDFILAIESSLGIDADKVYLPMQPGDVPRTWADISDMINLGYKSSFSIEEGIPLFVKWFKEYYNIN